MSNPQFRPRQPVRFIGPGAPIPPNAPGRRRPGRVFAAVTAATALVVAVVVPVAASGTPTVAGSPVAHDTAPTTSGSSRSSKRPTSTTPTTTTSKRSVLEPEPDANPAACQLVSWEDLPADVRPKKTKEPQPKSTDNPEVFRCWMDNSAASVPVQGPNDPPAPPGGNQSTLDYFKVDVYLGKPINAEVGAHEGNPKLDEVREITVGEYSGVLVRDRSNDGKKDVPRCFVAFRTPKNKALAEVTNDRFPQYDACDLASQLAETIAPRVR